MKLAGIRVFGNGGARAHSVQSRRFSKERFTTVQATHSRLFGWFTAAALALGSTPTLAQEGSASDGKDKSAPCTACHGTDGNSMAAVLGPSLAGQHPEYLVNQLQAFKDGERPDVSSMRATAATLSEQDMRDIAAYFGEQSITVKGADPELVTRGERIYRGGIPEREVPACIACHGPSGAGNELAGYPRVSHQHSVYLAKTLRDYRSGDRRSDAELNQMMRNVAEFLLDDEIDALASYMQGLN